ncbi:acetate/propionate family kinase [Martelella sp. AD-3]|uniref:acetate/propionate family kinase n=1 Tax=Martelella sp. AD-3 TaxID=686597 RepID=UPI00046711A2|nr:acetate/propionate family kinase [Martelella sp. AD-3]AMM84091.1 acetate kinase [Martelella sp. AD-3]
MNGTVLALNAGSSSLKFRLYEVEGDHFSLVLRGQFDGVNENPRLVVKEAGGKEICNMDLEIGEHMQEDMLERIFGVIKPYTANSPLQAVGHRVLHGGGRFADPVLLDDEIVSYLETLIPMGPLHQPANLASIKLFRRIRPDLPQVACFDTAFHVNIDERAARYPIPLEYEAKGYRRFGFHGLSYTYIADRLREISDYLVKKRTVVAHLGSGSSMCAMRNGKAIDTTMGLTPLGGLMMGTRSGTVDPGLVLTLMEAENLTPAEIKHMLYYKSGLLGVSGISGDLRVLMESKDPNARKAIDLFVFRACRELSIMVATMEGMESLVFSAGIGENSPVIRKMICDRLGWLGVQLDDDANNANAEIISCPESRVEVRVIPTDEEIVLARQTARVVSEAVKAGREPSYA